MSRLGAGTGNVVGGPINCGGTCMADVPAGTSVTLTATANMGSTFAGWSGCDSAMGATCTVLMNAQRSVTATFNVSTVPTYTLTVAKSGTGSGTVTGGGISCGTTCSATVNQGTVVTLTAMAASGSTFSSWSGCDSTSGATCTVTMNSARTVTASFTANPTSYLLTVTKSGAGSGTVSGGAINCGTTCSATLNAGTMVTLTASPSSGSTFSSWTGCDSVSGATCTVTMNAPRTVTASFALTPTYTLTVTKAGLGSGTVTGGSISCGTTCSQTAAAGSSITLTATASSGSSFSSWSGCTSSSGNTCNVTLNSNMTVTATFALSSVCTVGATRCVVGNVSALETCNGLGWVRSSCASNQMCTNSACRTVCELTTSPAYPSICMVPNNDGVNNGNLFLWTDSRLAYPNLSNGSAMFNSTTAASVYSAAGQVWPYAWTVSSAGLAGVQFKLSSFSPGRTVYLRYRARRAGIITGNLNQYTAAFFAGNTMVDSGTAGTVPYSFATGWVSTNVSTLSYSSSVWNLGALSITGDGFGGTIDLLEVNWLLIEVR
ncbi:MAG: hypothetical protein AB1938_32235 [Myxococcota bacterium]